MGLALVGDVLSRPRPVGQRENRTSTRLSHGTTPTSRHLCRKVPWDQRENRTLTPLSHGTQHSERSSYHRRRSYVSSRGVGVWFSRVR